MNQRNTSFWKLNLILLLLLSWAITSNAQYMNNKSKQTKIVEPLLKVLSNFLNEEQSDLVKGFERKNTYLSSSLFFFSENIQLCKDILTEMSENENTTLDSLQEPSKTENDSLSLPKQDDRIKKEQSLSIWNHPGNSNTGI